MKQFDLGCCVIAELSEGGISAVKVIAEQSLASTYDAYHSGDEEPLEDHEDDGTDDQPIHQFFGDRDVA